MAALLVDALPTGDEWLYEAKFDRYRALALKNGAGVKLLSRTGNDLTADYPAIRQAVAALRAKSALIDGEIVAFAVTEVGLEGVVAKRRDSRYEAGKRSGLWQKCPFTDLPSSRTGHWGEGVTVEDMKILKWVKRRQPAPFGVCGAALGQGCPHNRARASQCVEREAGLKPCATSRAVDNSWSS